MEEDTSGGNGVRQIATVRSRLKDVGLAVAAALDLPLSDGERARLMKVGNSAVKMYNDLAPMIESRLPPPPPAPPVPEEGADQEAQPEQ